MKSTAIRRMSKKREAALREESRGAPIFSTFSARGGRIRPRNPEKARKEFLRAFGGDARQAWVASLPCCACGYSAKRSHNHHIVSGGKGRKADARYIVPLCIAHDIGTVPVVGCHRRLHDMGPASFERLAKINLDEIAAQVEAAWLARNLETHAA